MHLPVLLSYGSQCGCEPTKLFILSYWMSLGLNIFQSPVSPVTVQTSEVKNPQKTFEHEQYLFNGDTNGKQLLGAVMIMNDYDEDEG